LTNQKQGAAVTSYLVHPSSFLEGVIGFAAPFTTKPWQAVQNAKPKTILMSQIDMF
jgi:hypothetical protein